MNYYPVYGTEVPFGACCGVQVFSRAKNVAGYFLCVADKRSYCMICVISASSLDDFVTQRFYKSRIPLIMHEPPVRTLSSE